MVLPTPQAPYRTRELRCASVRDPIIKTLGAVARELREKQGVLAVEIGARIRHTEGVISRFERGETTPRDLDLMVQGYADELGIAPEEIWRLAIDRWASQPLPQQAAVAAAQRGAQRRRSRQQGDPGVAAPPRRSAQGG